MGGPIHPQAQERNKAHKRRMMRIITRFWGSRAGWQGAALKAALDFGKILRSGGTEPAERAVEL